MNTDPLTFALLTLAGVSLFFGLASGVCALLDIMQHRKTDAQADPYDDWL